MLPSLPERPYNLEVLEEATFLFDAFTANLPDMSDAVLTERLDLGAETFLLQVSPVRRFDDYGPDVDVVHAWALRPDGTPLTLHVLAPNASREAAYNLWSFLCDQLTAAAVLVYGIVPNANGIANPRLGCWGARPDLAGPDADDAATALVIGIAVDTTNARRKGRHDLFALSVRSALVAVLRRWIVETRPRHSVNPRAN
jgi:hypothetical protein